MWNPISAGFKSLLFGTLSLPKQSVGSVHVTYLLLRRKGKDWIEIGAFFGFTFIFSLIYPFALSAQSLFHHIYQCHPISENHKKSLLTKKSLFNRTSTLENHHLFQTNQQRVEFLNQIKLCPVPKGSIIDKWLLDSSAGMAVGKTIYIDSERWKGPGFTSLIIHEVCHCIQYHTHKGGDIGFLAQYFAQYLSQYARTRDLDQAYLNIEAEKEAYAVESQQQYEPKY